MPCGVLSGAMDPEKVHVDPTMKEVGAVIRDALKSEREPSARKELVELLTQFRPSMHLEGASALVAATDDPDDGVRQAAIRTLTDSLGDSTCPKDEEVREKLREVAPLILRDAKGRKRTSALLALGFLGEDGAVGGLLDLLHDPDESFRRSAAVALGRLGYAAFVLRSVNDDRLGAELRKAVPPLVAALEEPVDDVRRHASKRAGEHGRRGSRRDPGHRESGREGDCPVSPLEHDGVWPKYQAGGGNRPSTCQLGHGEGRRAPALKERGVRDVPAVDAPRSLMSFDSQDR